MNGRRLLQLTALALSLVGTACTSSSPTVENFAPPKAPEDPPWGLDSVNVPDDKQAIRAIFSAFPERISGHKMYKTLPTCFLCDPHYCAPLGACYGEFSSIIAGPVASGAYGDYRFDRNRRWRTVGEYFRHRFRVEPGDVIDWGGVDQRSVVEAIDGNPSDGLLWIVWGRSPQTVMGGSFLGHLTPISSSPWTRTRRSASGLTRW